MKKVHPVVPKKPVDLTTHRDRPGKAGAVYHPAVDIYETEKELVIMADMPGVSPDKVSLDLRREELVMDGEVTHEEYEGENVLYAEYDVGHWHRHFLLPENVDKDNISAKMADGVLTLTIPKIKAAAAKKIAVRVGKG